MNVLLSVLVRRTSKQVSAPQHPVRTCVGCRTRTQASELLRVVATSRSSDSPPALGVLSVEVDERRRMPGRGAWVHPNPECVVLAEKRRAFGRALRLTGAVDTSAVHDHVLSNVDVNSSSHTAPPVPAVAAGGRPNVSRK